MSYTWEQVQLGIDVQDEEKREEIDRRVIEGKITQESTNKAIGSLVGSVLGFALGFGPIGMAIGGGLGRWAGDATVKWEDDSIDPGKFNVDEMIEYNESLAELAEDQNWADIINLGTSIASAYVQAGGLQPGKTDWTTFGSGGAAGGEWSLYQEGTAPVDPTFIPGADPTLEATMTPAVTASADFVPGLLTSPEGIWSKLNPFAYGRGELSFGQGAIGVGTAYKQGLTADYILKQYEDYIKGTQEDID